MSGHLQFYKDKDGSPQLIPGPYTQDTREYWLRRILRAQSEIRSDELSPDYVQGLELVTLSELEEIRRIWTQEKLEVEDLVPRIYEEEIGEPYPGPARPTTDLFSQELLGLLREACSHSEIRYETTRNLLAVERSFRLKGRRHGLLNELEKIIQRGCFENREEALAYKIKENEIKSQIQDAVDELADDESLRFELQIEKDGE